MKCKIIFSNNSKISIDKDSFKGNIKISDTTEEHIFLDKHFKSFRNDKDLFLFEEDDLLFGFACLKLEKDADSKAKIIYDQILNNLSGRKLYRCWNYVPNINLIEGRKEVYKKFNAGRKDAFHQFYGAGYEVNLPAATAIGIKGNNLVVMFIAGKNNPKNLENPNQCPVYKYPEKYGKKRPNFARATKINNKYYFISGTASIKGSSSKYKGDTEKQWNLMTENLNMMISKGEKITETKSVFAIIYFRNKKDLVLIKKKFAEDFSSIKKAIFLQTNICRKELDVETEISFGFFS